MLNFYHNLPLLIRVHTMLPTSMCHAMPFSACVLKKVFSLMFIPWGKKQIKMWFIVAHTLINNEYASLLFSKTIFFYCFCMLSEFAKVFEWKVWRMQVARLHNAGLALTSQSRCFHQLSTNLDKDFFRYLWYCGKKQIKCGLAWSVLLSTTIRVITVVKICCETILLGKQSVAKILFWFIYACRHKAQFSWVY